MCTTDDQDVCAKECPSPDGVALIPHTNTHTDLDFNCLQSAVSTLCIYPDIHFLPLAQKYSEQQLSGSLDYYVPLKHTQHTHLRTHTHLHTRTPCWPISPP